jgi:hypothetical protein
MVYATAADVTVELGRSAVSEAESQQWDAWIARVERSIVRAFRRNGFDLDEQVSLGNPTAEDVRDVEVAIVIRKIQNPNWGESSVTKSLDDGSVTRRREGGEGDPLTLLDVDLSTLLPERTSGAFSTRPAFVPDYGYYYPLEGWRL